MTRESTRQSEANPGDQVLGVVMRAEGRTIDDRVFMRPWLKILVGIAVMVSPLAIAGVLMLNRILDYAGTRFVD